MLVILKNKTNQRQSITVHNGEMVVVKPDDTLIVCCDHDRFPYYATLKRIGFEVTVQEVYYLAEAKIVNATTESAIEETTVEPTVVEEPKVEEVEIEPVRVEDINVEELVDEAPVEETSVEEEPTEIETTEENSETEAPIEEVKTKVTGRSAKKVSV